MELPEQPVPDPPPLLATRICDLALKIEGSEVEKVAQQPYRENYRPVLFSKDYVRYLPGWYAQKHPDEDFAETFAVWMTPRSGWRKKYRGWGAIAKLHYMDRIGRELGSVDPLRKRGTPDVTVAEMEMTVEEFYRNS